MVTDNLWQERFQFELRIAEDARKKGLEGQVRVCARRAAGIILREYARKRGHQNQAISSYDLIQVYSEDAELSQEVRDILQMMTLRVLPGGVFPGESDLIRLARLLPELIGLNTSELKDSST